MDSTGECAACAPVNFETIQSTFPAGLNQKFMMSMAYASPGTPEFCGVVQDGICADFEANTCCCDAEMAAWQSCLVKKDFSIAIGQTDPCTVSCALPAAAGNGGGGGGSMVTIVIVVLLVLVAGGGLGRYLFIRKRRANANGKIVNDSDDDTFKDENGKSVKGGFFSIFKKGSGTPPGSESEDYDREKKKGKKNGRNRSEYEMDDVEHGGLIHDVPHSDEEMDADNRRSRRSRNGSRKKRYEEEDSIDNKYGEYSKDGSQRNSRRPSRSKYNSESEDNFDDDTISEFSKDYGKSRVSTSDLPDKIQSSRKISSRELKELIRDREERSGQLDFMQKEMKNFEERLSLRDREAKDLRRSRADQDRRIRELEAMNARLKQESMSNHSEGSSTSDAYGGQSSRSKASMREGEDKKNKTDRRRNGRSRSASGRSLMERSNSSRSLKRQGSNKSLGRQQQLNSRSPSSSRGLGKQSSTMRRSASKSKLGQDVSTMRRSASKSKLEQDDPREYSKDREEGKNSKKAQASRSKSPRSYLRDEV
jgi:hypothetical protein